MTVRSSSKIAWLALGILGMGFLSYGLRGISLLERRLAHLEAVEQAQFSEIVRDLVGIRNQFGMVVSKARSETSESAENHEVQAPSRFATLDEAKSEIKKLGDHPSPDDLAETLAEMDEWLIESGQEEPFRKLKLEQQARLRQLVSAHVEAHQDAALRASSGAAAAMEYAEAGRVLAMYPMSDDTQVIDEAKRLASQQAEIASRLEVIRRQKYNRWATVQIEKALDFYNANVSKWNPFNDNTILIRALVNNLGQVDPSALEPAVLELYNYVIDRTKGSLSEKNKVELAKQLTDPSIRRKTMGDF